MKLEIESQHMALGGNPHPMLVIDNIPACVIMPYAIKDPITPTGWGEYCRHKDEIDKCIEKHFKNCSVV